MTGQPVGSQRIGILVETIAKALHLPPSQVLSADAAYALGELLAAELTVRGVPATPKPLGGWPEEAA